MTPRVYAEQFREYVLHDYGIIITVPAGGYIDTHQSEENFVWSWFGPAILHTVSLEVQHSEEPQLDGLSQFLGMRLAEHLAYNDTLGVARAEPYNFGGLEWQSWVRSYIGTDNEIGRELYYLSEQTNRIYLICVGYDMSNEVEAIQQIGIVLGKITLLLIPSKYELDRMSEWEENQRRKVRMLARTPSSMLEQKRKGKVTFSVTCDSRGKLLGVSIVKSGGHGELDQECKEATRTARFDKFPAGVPFTKWKFDMTLQFPIEGGY